MSFDYNAMRILYIDDDLEDIEIFQEAVNTVDPSIEFTSAHGGLEALAYLASCEALPDHIVLDINMPGMDGKRCLQEIRKEKAFDGINIIVSSTNGFPQDIEEIRALGAVFIQKAHSFSGLCQVVRDLKGN